MKKEYPNLELDQEAIRVISKSKPVGVHFAITDGTCETLEGPVRYNAGDAIITGNHGENWPVKRERFMASYQPEGDLIAGEDGTYQKIPKAALAKRLNVETRVPVQHRDSELLGRPGDWLIQYSEGDYGIVAADIFIDTYQVIEDSPRT